MAQEILDVHKTGKMQAAIGRASDFFGPYDTALTGYAILPAVQIKTVNLRAAAARRIPFEAHPVEAGIERDA